MSLSLTPNLQAMARRSKFPWGLLVLAGLGYLAYKEWEHQASAVIVPEPGPAGPQLLPNAPATTALLPVASTSPGAATTPALNAPVIQQLAQQTTAINTGMAIEQPATSTYTLVRNGSPSTIQRFNPL